jgi:ABC-type Zn uptake system ZnuABC Zn-binding protein ZnuA
MTGDRGHRRSAACLASALVLCAACSGGEVVSGDVPGCGTGAPVVGRPVRVATTVAPITSIVANIAGGSGTVIEGLVPEGTNSHTYEPAPSVAVILERADVVFLNGLALEEPTRELAVANLSPGGEVCELGTTVLTPDRYLYDFSFPESGGVPNPHLWTDPLFAERYAELVRDVLSVRDPVHADIFDTNFRAFSARVGALDAAIRTATSTVPVEHRVLLTYHDAYAYFAEDYGWTVLGAIQPSSFDEPTPRDVARLVEQVRAVRVPAIFGSEVFPSPVLAQIAAETGATYVDDLRDDDLPGRPGDPDHSWFALMRFNYETLVTALGGDASALRALDVRDVAPDAATYPQ